MANNNHTNKKFGLVIGGVLMACLTYQIVFHHKVWFGVLSIAIILLLLALSAPYALNPLRIVWDKIGQVLGTVNTWLILSAVFFLIVTPMGWVLRLFRKNLISRKWKTGSHTYWKTVDNEVKGSFKQQF